MPERLLAPPPRRLRLTGGWLALPRGWALRLDGDRRGVRAALDRLARADQAFDRHGPELRLEIDPALSLEIRGRMQEGYRLEIRDSGVRLAARHAAGLSHGLSTLEQWIRIHSTGERPVRLPTLLIEDAPTIPNRGVLLDVSRCRVPTMDALLSLIDRLASWKINQLQLYFEHTFAYRGHEEVWRHSSPITPAEVRQLDAYCVERHIELVPNQNSFGHLHRWLEHDRYRPLAECPEGIEHPFADHPTPFSLCPLDPGSLELLADLYRQLLPNFTSRHLHIGFDETIDLGKGRSREAAEDVGVVQLYADFLARVSGLAAQHGRDVQLWGDILLKDPANLRLVPPGATVLEWGYEASHRFDEKARCLRQAGIEFYLCPGTSSWLSLAGRYSNAAANIAAATAAAALHGAAGLLVTDWGDQGHLQPPSVSLPGFLTAAALFWNPEARILGSSEGITPLLDLHAFASESGDGPASALLELAEVYRLPGASTFNGSPLFYLLTRPDMALDHPRLSGLSLGGLERCRQVVEGSAVGAANQTETVWLRQAIGVATELGTARLRHRATSSSRQLPTAQRHQLAHQLGEVIDRYRALWSESSRPGGLEESSLQLERARDALSS